MFGEELCFCVVYATPAQMSTAISRGVLSGIAHDAYHRPTERITLHQGKTSLPKFVVKQAFLSECHFYNDFSVEVIDKYFCNVVYISCCVDQVNFTCIS